MNPPNDIKASKRPDPEHLDGRDSKGSHKQDVRVAHSNHSDRPSNHNMEPRMDSGVSLLSGNVSAPAASSTTKLAVKPKFDIIQTLKIDIASKLKFILNPRSVATTQSWIMWKDQQYLASFFPKCATNYVAVSHKWGAISNLYDDSPNSPLHVTPVSDLSKLVLMQHLVANGNVWIDVYDIIQGKVSGEQRNVKSAQVELMGEVYFYADLVLWVTTARDDQTLALLEDADADNIQSWAQKESCRILSWSPPRDGGAFEHWTRAWTYQEIALAKELHAVSPYTGRDWKMRLMLKKIRNIWTKVGKESRDHELEELKQLRRMIMGALNDLELVSQARSHNHVSGMNNKRLIRELGTSRISTRAKDILFTHLWILGIPKGLLVYSESVEWNIRQFCAHLISRGQLTIGANNAAPVGVENACWIPPVLFKLLDDDANKREGDTSILKLVKLRPEDRIIPTRVLDDGRLELKTMVKQLHGDVWIAFLNGRESVVFLKSTSHTVVVTDSNWTGGQLETVSFGTTQPESFELDTTVANNVTDPPKVYYRHTD
ncbi:hypothetical protein HK100_006932 [Physocladia obscura]|uniref:Heterokaryon incompatibility domain-containing protein n=1 Tax=Physocladia obscura TaxID=109957 RepID=A0AAD5X8J2_9FUNG|nr:hypothetical protein HK100_006932 [Physocladia obscura]